MKHVRLTNVEKRLLKRAIKEKMRFGVTKASELFRALQRENLFGVDRPLNYQHVNGLIKREGLRGKKFYAPRASVPQRVAAEGPKVSSSVGFKVFEALYNNGVPMEKAFDIAAGLR